MGKRTGRCFSKGSFELYGFCLCITGTEPIFFTDLLRLCGNTLSWMTKSYIDFAWEVVYIIHLTGGANDEIPHGSQ